MTQDPRRLLPRPRTWPDALACVLVVLGAVIGLAVILAGVAVAVYLAP